MEIEFKNYTKKEKDEIIFDDLNLKITSSKIYAVVGDDNSNKDKLFLNLKKSKNVNLNNAKISIIEKDNTLFNENIKYLKYLYKHTKIKEEDKILELISLLEIDKNIIDSNLNELNNYCLKLLMIIINLVNGSNVIVLKEPFYKMNADNENSFIRILKLLKKEYEITFIILTKNTNIIYKFIDYFFVLYRGKIVLEGTREELENINSDYGIEKPEICSFISIIRKKYDKYFRSFNDVRDLVKEIYRCTR